MFCQCKHCLLDIVCVTPCEMFPEHIIISDFYLENHTRRLRLMNNYKMKAYIDYYKTKNEDLLQCEITYWNISFYKDTLLHRCDGPAKYSRDEKIEWYYEGRFHRENGPAIIFKNNSWSWYSHGKLHRTDGPAVRYPDGQEFYYINGELTPMGQRNELLRIVFN